MKPLPKEAWIAWGLPAPVENYRFHPTRKWELDYAWPDFKIAIEQQGGIWRRRGGAHQRSGHLRDMEKSNAAILAGFRVGQFTPKDVASGKAAEWVAKLVLARPFPRSRLSKLRASLKGGPHGGVCKAGDAEVADERDREALV